MFELVSLFRKYIIYRYFVTNSAVFFSLEFLNTEQTIDSCLFNIYVTNLYGKLRDRMSQWLGNVSLVHIVLTNSSCLQFIVIKCIFHTKNSSNFIAYDAVRWEFTFKRQSKKYFQFKCQKCCRVIDTSKKISSHQIQTLH